MNNNKGITRSGKKPLEINKILIFYNNFRGLDLSRYLSGKGYNVFNIITKKFLNAKIINKINKNNLKIIKNLKSKDILNFIKKKKSDLIILAGFPHILNKKFFNLAKHGIINLHAGKLPKYKGGSPLVWQILNKEKNIGISIIKINKKIDGGKIVCRAEFKNLKSDNIMKVHKKVNKIFLGLTLHAIKRISENKTLQTQAKSKFYFKQRRDKDALIDFNCNNLDIFNLVRSQSKPYKGAFFFNNNRKFRLHECKMTSLCPKLKNGTIFKFVNKKTIFIKCKSNSIKLIKINPGTNFLKKIKVI